MTFIFGELDRSWIDRGHNHAIRKAVITGVSVGAAVVACQLLLTITNSRVGTGAVYVIAVSIASMVAGRRFGFLAAATAVSVYHLLLSVWGGSGPIDIMTPNLGVVYLSIFFVAFSASGPLERIKKSATWLPAKPNFWNPPRVQDFAQQIEIGERIARRMLKEMNEKQQPFLLGWVVRDMIKMNAFSGLEIGFCGAIARSAMTETYLIQDTSDQLDFESLIIRSESSISARPIGAQEAGTNIYA